MYKTVKNDQLKPFSVKQFADMANGYVIQATDQFGSMKGGYPSLKNFDVTDFLHTRKSWEEKSIRKGMLPYIARIDPYTGVEYECYMTMNCIEIDPRDPEVIHRLQFLITFPGSITLEALGVIEEVFTKYIDDEDRARRGNEGPYGIIDRLQRALITFQNQLFSDTSGCCCKRI